MLCFRIELGLDVQNKDGFLVHKGYVAYTKFGIRRSPDEFEGAVRRILRLNLLGQREKETNPEIHRQRQRLSRKGTYTRFGRKEGLLPTED